MRACGHEQKRSTGKLHATTRRLVTQGPCGCPSDGRRGWLQGPWLNQAAVLVVVLRRPIMIRRVLKRGEHIALLRHHVHGGKAIIHEVPSRRAVVDQLGA